MPLANILQEEDVITNDIKVDLEVEDDFYISEGKMSLVKALPNFPLSPLLSPLDFPSKDISDCSISPVIEPLSSEHCFNLLAKLSYLLLLPPSLIPRDLDFPMDQKTQRLLQDYMNDDEDLDFVLDTPLVVMYSKIKEKRKLGLHQFLEEKEKPNFGSSPPKKGRRYLIEARSQDGAAENQSKITDLWKVGKENSLPEQQ